MDEFRTSLERIFNDHKEGCAWYHDSTCNCGLRWKHDEAMKLIESLRFMCGCEVDTTGMELDHSKCVSTVRNNDDCFCSCDDCQDCEYK